MTNLTLTDVVNYMQSEHPSLRKQGVKVYISMLEAAGDTTTLIEILKDRLAYPHHDRLSSEHDKRTELSDSLTLKAVAALVRMKCGEAVEVLYQLKCSDPLFGGKGAEADVALRRLQSLGHRRTENSDTIQTARDKVRSWLGIVRTPAVKEPA